MSRLRTPNRRNAPAGSRGAPIVGQFGIKLNPISPTGGPVLGVIQIVTKDSDSDFEFLPTIRGPVSLPPENCRMRVGSIDVEVTEVAVATSGVVAISFEPANQDGSVILAVEGQNDGWALMGKFVNAPIYQEAQVEP